MTTISYQYIILYMTFNLVFDVITNHVLLELTEDIRNTIDNDHYTVGIFIDLQNAFGTVDHNILLYKLNYYGIRGLANDWFKSYLINRKLFVTIQGVD